MKTYMRQTTSPQTTEVKAEYAENPLESWSNAAADSEEMMKISPNVVKAGIAEADDAKKPGWGCRRDY